MPPEPRERPDSPGQRSPLSETGHLLDLVRAGDRTAGERLFGLYHDRLQSFLHGRLGRRDRRLLETVDLVHDVITRALSRLDRFEYRGVGSFWAYVRQSALNEVRAVWRRAAARKDELPPSEDLPDEPSSEGEGALERLITREDYESFEQGVEALPARAREALLLRLELDLGYGAVAKECGFASPDAARVAVRRALAQVAGRMGAP